MVIVGALGWALFFYLLEKFNNRCSSDWNIRICAMVHGFIACRFIELNIDWPWDLTLFGKESMDWHYQVEIFTGSFFTFYTIYGLIAQNESKLMTLHHVVSLICVSYPLLQGVSGYDAVIAIWLTELTNPSVHLRWMLRSLELHNSRLAVINEIVFVLVFFVNRMFLGTYVIYTLIVAENTAWFVKIGAAAFQIINSLFSYQLAQMVVRKFVRKEEVRYSSVSPK